MSYKLLMLVMLVAFGVTGWAAAEGKKKIPDSQRIEQLEQQVMSLQQDLLGAHMWAASVNDRLDQDDDRTFDLNKRLTAVENRGPVAQR